MAVKTPMRPASDGIQVTIEPEVIFIDDKSDVMYQWMDAYRAGLGTSEAQIQVRKFSSTKYKSHQCIPEAVARAFD